MSPEAKLVAQAAKRRWAQANRARLRELNRRWRAEHPEKARRQARDRMERYRKRLRRVTGCSNQGTSEFLT